jgi:ankyrin repeat protein
MNIFRAIETKYLQRFRELVKMPNFDVNQSTSEGWTPLTWACLHLALHTKYPLDRFDIPYLLDMIDDLLNIPEINVNIIADGKSALSMVYESGNMDLFTRLIFHGADINFQDESGKTSLIKAVIDSDIPKIDLLIFVDADVTIHDDEGKTALDYARVGANQIIINTIERELRDAVIKVYGDKTSIGGSSTQILLEYIGIPEPVNIHIGGYYNKLQKYLNKRIYR